MSLSILPRHPGLWATSRLRHLATQAFTPNVRDWLTLIAFGILATCSSTFMDDLLKSVLANVTSREIKQVPGHAILRVVFPLALGLAVVPRSGAGCVMGGTAALAGASLQWAGLRGESIGFGALTSLIATGPLLDWTLRRTHGGWRQVLSFALAGMTSNVLALAVRGTTKALGWEAPLRRPLMEWLSQAVGTYILCGLLAGLISSVILFSIRSRPDAPPPETDA